MEKLSSGDVECPARPKFSQSMGYYSAPPSWVLPLSVSIAHGGGVPEAKNGIGFTPECDLLLYRKLSKEDYDRFPLLEGIDEVWITYRINWEDD